MKGLGAWMAPRTSSVLALGGAALLLASLWLPWFATARSCAPPCPSDTRRFTAWESFSEADIVFVALALLAGGAITGGGWWAIRPGRPTP